MLALYLAGLGMAAAPLQPTARWTVDFADARCVASRAYGEDIIALKAAPGGDVIQLALVRPGRGGQPEQVEARIVPDAGAAFTGSALSYTSEGKPPNRLLVVNVPRAEFERLSQSPTLKFSLGTADRHLAMSGMDKLAPVLKACVDDLQQMWPDGESLAAKPSTNLAALFTADDYPQQAIRSELSGTTSFALLVDETGKVADCTVMSSSGSAALDAQSCAMIRKRARYSPARDASGKPSKSRITSRIMWRLPED